jgi:hypothetical protein
MCSIKTTPTTHRVTADAAILRSHKTTTYFYIAYYVKKKMYENETPIQFATVVPHTFPLFRMEMTNMLPYYASGG